MPNGQHQIPDWVLNYPGPHVGTGPPSDAVQPTQAAPKTSEVKPWSEISKNFDPMMPAEVYDNLRLKYFTSFVAPKVPKGKSVEATYAEFKKLTDRPSLLSAGGKAVLQVAVAGGAAAESALGPIAGAGGGKAKQDLDWTRQFNKTVTRVAEREGMNVGAMRATGSLAGAAADFGILQEALGPMASGIAGEAIENAKAAEVAGRLIRGGSTFATYDGLAADKPNRLQAGLKGFVVGAGFDLALSVPGLLKYQGAAKTVEEAQEAVEGANAGRPKSAQIDAVLTQKARHDAEIGRLELRPEQSSWSYTTGMRGARVYVKDLAGQNTPFDIKPGREYETYRQIRALVSQGGSVDRYEVHPDDTRTLNEFVRIQGAAEEAKYRGTVIRTPPGQAEAVAATAKGEGMPAEAVSKNTVEVATVPIQHPVLNRPEPAEGPPETPLTPEQIKTTLDSNAKFDAKQREFLNYHVNKVWDPKVDYEDKRASIVITARQVPELLPEQYKTLMAKGRGGPKPAPVGEPVVEKANPIEEARLEEINRPIAKKVNTSHIDRPSDPKFRLQEMIPQSEAVEYRSVKDGVRSQGTTHDSLADAIDARGDVKLLKNPAGEKDLITQVKESTLDGRLMGSIEDVKPQEMVPAMTALRKKGWMVLPIKGYKPNEFELVYFRPGDTQRIAPLLQDYDNYVSQQAGRIFNTDGKPVQEVGDVAHARLGKAFGVPAGEIDNFARERQSGGSRVAPEIAKKPYGNRLVLQYEDLQKLYPNAVGMAVPSMNEFLEEIGKDVPPSLRGGDPLIILTPETSKETIFHERLHVNGMHAGTYDNFPEHISPEHKQTALELANGLMRDFPGYKNLGTRVAVEEAYTHAATAVRYGDRSYLDHLARYDRSVPHVIDFVHDTSNNLLERSFRSSDTVPIRIFQRTLWDLMRRTSGQVSEALEQGSRATGSGIGAWYDSVGDRWVLKTSPNTQLEFKDINGLWDHVLDNDKNFMAPSMSLRAEMGGVRGPITPIGKEPSGASLPSPEVPPEKYKVGMSAASGLWRPFFPWIATAHEKLNAAWRSQGKYLPLYETAKKVDDAYRAGEVWLQRSYDTAADLLAPFKGQKMKSAFDYLTLSEKERTPQAQAKYGLTAQEAAQAGKVWNYLLDLQGDTKLNITQYMNEYHPKLRAFGWAPERVFGMLTTPQSASYWDRMIRHDMKWDPQDGHLGRFVTTMMREGMEKKFTGGPLDDLEKLVERKTPDGQYVIPNPMRWPVTNYTRYMRGIPDTSQQVINKTMSDFFGHANDKIKALNEMLPKDHQIPQITTPPKAIMNRFMLMSYAMGLGMRPAIAIRDTFQAFTGGMTVLGPTRFAKAFTKFMSAPSDGFALADKAGALLRKNSIGELHGDITSETPAVGPGWMDRLARWSNMLLAPSRWGHNFGRAITYAGEYEDAVEGIRSYRAGRQSIDQLLESTSMWFMDRPAQSNLLRYVSDSHVPVEDAAKRIALETVDLTQWPYRRGTQPTLLRYGAGRIFGQYGVWPANYADFLYRIGKKWTERPHMAARTTATWVAVNYALSHAMEGIGADTSKWFYVSPAGFAGSPHWDLVKAMMVAPENTDEGRQARKTILEYPLNFVPAMSEMRSVARAIQEGGANEWPPDHASIMRALGFKPLDDMEKEQEWEDYVKTQLGYENARRRP